MKDVKAEEDIPLYVMELLIILLSPFSMYQ